MGRSVTTYVLTCLVLAVSAFAGAQDFKIPDTPEVLHVAPAPTDRFPAKWYPRVGDGTDVLPAPVLNQPYTAFVSSPGTPHDSRSEESLREGKDGFQARDRFGRTYSEGEISGGIAIDGKSVPTKSVTVNDPVTHCQFHWTKLVMSAEVPTEMRSALVTCGPQTVRYQDFDLYGMVLNGLVDGTSVQGAITTRTEHLAPVQMEGVTVKGVRVSETRRSEQGEVKKTVTETWYSPELRELIRLGGEEEGYLGLTDIHRVDPDPKLFYPPDGWKIEVQPDTRTAPKN